jgi:hypothetical protein
MLLQDKAQQCQLLRLQIDELVSAELYTVEDIAVLSQQLHTLLHEPIQPGDNPEQYAAFLQQNLDWLHALMAKLSDEKDAVAASVLTIQQGKRARQSYGQHN